MKFTEHDLQSFIALYKQEFNQDIDRAEALRQATDLVWLVKRLYKPMTVERFRKTVAIMRETD